MSVQWHKAWVSDERFEAACVCDVDADGIPDIVSGGYWYRGPDFRQKRPIVEVTAVGEYFDDLAAVPLDITGNGLPDIVTGSWWGPIRWRENPWPGDGPWTEHLISDVGPVETLRGWDLDGDGRLEIVPNIPTSQEVIVFRFTAGTFEQHVLYRFAKGESQGHGLGCGDISGAGRSDLVFSGGWLEAPPDTWHGEWIWHRDFNLGVASVPIIVADIDDDGRSELIVGQAHGYGLDWWRREGPSDRPSWTQHSIDALNAQFHEMQWVDIDGDGRCELVTGSRHRAHNGNDAGEWDDSGIYWFKWAGESFSKQIIDYGPPGAGASTGIQFAAADLNSDGRLDLIMPGKDGLYVYRNRAMPHDY